MPENRFCVYIHRRANDLKIFYVGKGSKKRSKTSRGRSQYWQRIVAKHGYVVEIILSGIDELSAFELEAFLIAEIGRENLCNLTDGGEGCSGREMPGHQRAKASAMLKGKPLPKETVLAAIQKNSKPIGTVCGLRFPSAREAARYLNTNGFPTACDAGIASCLSGKAKNAYGFEWRRVAQDGTLEPSSFSPKPRKLKPVGNDLSMIFDGVASAAEWCKSIGYPEAQTSNITSACAGRVSTAYGHRWGFVANGAILIPEWKKSRIINPVVTECGMSFPSQRDAAKWLAVNHGVNFFTALNMVSFCVNGKIDEYIGYKWKKSEVHFEKIA